MILDLLLPGGVNIADPMGGKFPDLASVVNEALKYIFPLGGLVLFFMLISGGFQLLTAADNADEVKKGYNKILYALIGFLVIFVSYWLVQILEYVLGIKVF